jgi:hypothetical protein
MEFKKLKENVEKILIELENAISVANQSAGNSHKSNYQNDIILGSKEVCKHLGIGPATLSRWKKEGLIKCSQLQRKGKNMYSLKEIEQMLKENTIRKY